MGLKCENCNMIYNNSPYLNINRINNSPIRFLHTCKECRKIKRCGNCNSEFKHYQNQTCSKKCAANLKEKTYMLTQGAPHNFSKNSKSKIKMQLELLENEGISNVFQRDTVKDSIEATMLARYGVDNISKSDDIKTKKKETLRQTLIDNPDLLKNQWWDRHHRFIKDIGYDPRLGVFGKASIESMLIFNPISKLCKSLGILESDIYIGHGTKSEYFINTGTKTYFYDFCIRSRNIIIEYHGIGFHANPTWELTKLNEWKSAFTNETSSENIRKTKIKNNVAINKGFKILEIWSDSDIENNINLCKAFINDNI